MSITWLEHWCSPIVRASLIRDDDRGQAPQQQQQQQRNAQIASWFGCWLFYLPQVQSSKKCRVRVPVAFPVAVPTHPFKKKKKKESVADGLDGVMVWAHFQSKSLRLLTATRTTTGETSGDCTRQHFGSKLAKLSAAYMSAQSKHCAAVWVRMALGSLSFCL